MEPLIEIESIISVITGKPGKALSRGQLYKPGKRFETTKILSTYNRQRTSWRRNDSPDLIRPQQQARNIAGQAAAHSEEGRARGAGAHLHGAYKSVTWTNFRKPESNWHISC
jgi:hypothetical protein